jgi:hypothetical protein
MTNPNDPGLSEAAITALERFGGKRGQQALAIVAAVQVSVPAIKWVKEKLNKREDYTITVGGQDEIYDDLHEWVLEHIPEIERKALIALLRAVRVDVDEEFKPLNQEQAKRLFLRIDRLASCD